MIGQGKETDSIDLGEVIGRGGRLNLTLDRSKYQKPEDCSCGTRYIRHGTVYPELPEALALWRQIYFRQRYHHPETYKCDNDGKTLKVGPDAYLSQWSEPLLDSLYVLGIPNMMISDLLPEGVASFVTVSLRVRHLDPEGLAIHHLLHNSLQYDLNIRGRKDEKKTIFEFFTMRVSNPPTAGWEVEVRRPIHQLTKRWIDARALTSVKHPTKGKLSFHLS